MLRAAPVHAARPAPGQPPQPRQVAEVHGEVGGEDGVLHHPQQPAVLRSRQRGQDVVALGVQNNQGLRKNICYPLKNIWYLAKKYVPG